MDILKKMTVAGGGTLFAYTLVVCPGFHHVCGPEKSHIEIEVNGSAEAGQFNRALYVATVSGSPILEGDWIFKELHL